MVTVGGVAAYDGQMPREGKVVYVVMDGLEDRSNLLRSLGDCHELVSQPCQVPSACWPSQSDTCRTVSPNQTSYCCRET